MIGDPSTPSVYLIDTDVIHMMFLHTASDQNWMVGRAGDKATKLPLSEMHESKMNEFHKKYATYNYHYVGEDLHIPMVSIP